MSHPIEGGILVLNFICHGSAFTAKGRVVRPSSPPVLPTRQMNSLELSGKSNPPLLPTPFPLILSTPLSLHIKSTPTFLSFLWFPVLPFVPHFAHCSFFNYLSPFIAIFLPLPPHSHPLKLHRGIVYPLSVETWKVEDTQSLLRKSGSLLLMFKHTCKCVSLSHVKFHHPQPLRK